MLYQAVCNKSFAVVSQQLLILAFARRDHCSWWRASGDPGALTWQSYDCRPVVLQLCCRGCCQAASWQLLLVAPSGFSFPTRGPFSESCLACSGVSLKMFWYLDLTVALPATTHLQLFLGFTCLEHGSWISKCLLSYIPIRYRFRA